MQPQLPNILDLEFNYIKDTAHQAIADRYTMLNFYIGICTAVGSVIVGVLASNQSQVALLGLAGLSLLTAIIGWIFLAIMFRLRQAWRESLIAMNRIKSFVLERQQETKDAFLWSVDSVPRLNKAWTIHFYSSLIVIILNSVFLAISCLLVGTSAGSWLGLAAIVLAVSLFLQITLYFKVFLR